MDKYEKHNNWFIYLLFLYTYNLDVYVMQFFNSILLLG